MCNVYGIGNGEIGNNDLVKGISKQSIQGHDNEAESLNDPDSVDDDQNRRKRIGEWIYK